MNFSHKIQSCPNNDCKFGFFGHFYINISEEIVADFMFLQNSFLKYRHIALKNIFDDVEDSD